MAREAGHLSFVADEATVALIEELKFGLHARTTAGVLRKALAFAGLVAGQAMESDGVVVLRGRSRPDSEAVEVALRG